MIGDKHSFQILNNFMWFFGDGKAFGSMWHKEGKKIWICSYWPVIIFGSSYLLLASDGPDGRGLSKGTDKTSNLHQSASP